MCTEQPQTSLIVRTPDESRLDPKLFVATEFFCMACGASVLLGPADETPSHLCRSTPPGYHPPGPPTAA